MRRAVQDAVGQGVGREAAKHNAVDGTNARTRELHACAQAQAHTMHTLTGVHTAQHARYSIPWHNTREHA